MLKQAGAHGSQLGGPGQRSRSTASNGARVSGAGHRRCSKRECRGIPSSSFPPPHFLPPTSTKGAQLECPAIKAGHSVPAWRVIHVLEQVAAERGLPTSIVCDNGPECAGTEMDRWAHERGLVLPFIRPGKPVENAYCESFNGTFRDECVNAHWFSTLADAQRVIEQCRGDCLEELPRPMCSGSCKLR